MPRRGLPDLGRLPMTAAAPIAVTHVSPFGDYEARAVFSGAENHLFDLMTGQKAAGLDVELMMLIVQDGPRLQAKANELRAQGIKVERVVYDRRLAGGIGRVAWVLQINKLVALMKSRRGRIIHTHQPHASQLGRIAAGMAGIRAVVDSVHNDEPFFARPTWRARLKALDRRTGMTIAISGRVKTHLVENVGLPDSKVTVIPYGVHPPARIDGLGARRALGLPAGAFVVGFVGRLTEQKDLPKLLEAMAGVTDAHLAIVGAGPLEAELRLRAEALRLANVLFAGHRDNAADLMPAFDVFALPSRWEGLGLVLLEAMARGVPIAASTGGAIPEVLDDGRLGLLSRVGDSAGLRANIQRLRSDSRLRDELAARGRDAVTQRFSIAAMVNATTHVYRSVLGQAG